MASGYCSWYTELYLWSLEDSESINDYGQICRVSVPDNQTFMTSGHLVFFLLVDEAGVNQVASWERK